jgi:two-component system, cell cycle response regulator
VKVLVAEDDVVFRRILESMLKKWDFQVVTASDGNQAWDILQGDNAPNLVILDWMMPGLDGLEICRRVRKRVMETYIYVILLTSRDQQGDLVAGLDAGADDFIKKPFDPLELRGRLRAGKRILDLQMDLVSAREELRYQATHDPLTRLMNRAAILSALQIELKRSLRQASPLAVAIVDIDKFKSVNDTFGHASGDAVLCEIAERMSNSIRPYDYIGRYGGEEFLVVFPGCDESNIRQMADRLLRVIREEPIPLRDTEITVTISLGVANYRFAEGEDMESMIRRADVALYRAKAEGRNRAILAGPEDEAQMPEKSPH